MNILEEHKQRICTINAVLSGQIPLETLDEVIEPSFVDHAAFPGQRPGLDGFKDAVRTLLAAFEQTVTSLHTVAEGDLVIDHWIARGIHRGAFMGIEPTGRSIALSV